MSTTLSNATVLPVDSMRNPFQQILAEPPPLRVMADNTVLLVVDMQYFDAHPDWGEGVRRRTLESLAASIPTSNRSTRSFRESSASLRSSAKRRWKLFICASLN